MKIKNKVAGFALALGAAVAPMASKATTETNAAPKSVEIAKAEKAQKLKEAIHLGLPREELLKHVDFPEWIPTTEDGNFDVEKANKMFNDAGLNKAENEKAFLDYVAAVEKGENADIAFQKFAKKITNGDTEKMAALNKIKDTLQETQRRTSKEDMTSNFGVGSLMLTILTVSIFTTLGQKCMKKDLSGLSSILFSGGAAIAGAMGITFALDGSLYKSYNRVTREIYNTYATQEIQKAANPKIVQMDMQQAKQFIEMAKQNGPVK